MVLAGVNDREQTTLWCGGIPREFVAGDLDKAAAKMRQLFEPFGRVATVTVRQKAAARGSWALVTFTNSAAIEKAMRAGVSVPSDDGQVIPTPLHVLGRISPISPPFFSFLRVFTVSTRRFQRAPSRNPGPRDSGNGAQTPFCRPS